MLFSASALYPLGKQLCGSARPDPPYLGFEARGSVLAAAGVIVSAPESNGLGMGRLLEPGSFGPLYMFGYMPRAWTVTLVGALVLWLCSYWGTRWTTLLPGLWAKSSAHWRRWWWGRSSSAGPRHRWNAGALQVIAGGVLLGPILVTAALRVIRHDEGGRAPLLVGRVSRIRLGGGGCRACDGAGGDVVQARRHRSRAQ